MELAAVFDPTNATSGQFTASTLQVGSTMIVDNKSYVDLIFTFASGDKRLIIANDRRAFQFSDASSVPAPFISWSQQNIDYPQTINQLQNICYVEIYAPTEKVIETYPNPIQRETLPSLVPYNIGYGAFQIGLTAGRNVSLFPSSYIGVSVAPTSPTVGMGFDHFWSYQNPSNANMLDLPGLYTASTGKTSNDATPNNIALMSAIPGPFSKPGLTPVDSATYLNGTYWQLASLIPWASSAANGGYFVDMWVNVPKSMAGVTQFLYCDDLAHFADTGFAVYISSGGVIDIEAAFTGGSVVSGTGYALQQGVWTYLAINWSSANNLLTMYANGVQVFSHATSGTPVNATHTPSIGSSPQDGGTFTGSICNVGILLSDITTNVWGTGAIQARYLLGLQSYANDYQNCWLRKVDFTVATEVATTVYGQIDIDNLYNPGGLLFAPTLSTVSPLHIYNQQLVSSILVIPPQSANQFTHYTFKYENAVTHPNDRFITIANFGFTTTGGNQGLYINVQATNSIGLA